MPYGVVRLGVAGEVVHVDFFRLQTPGLTVVLEVADQFVLLRIHTGDRIAVITVHEQHRIGRELHDTVMQQLTGAAMMLRNLPKGWTTTHRLSPPWRHVLVTS